MTLPVSSYEELLVQVRGLTHETILLQRQLSSDLFDDANGTDCDLNHNIDFARKNYENEKLLADSCDAVIRQRAENNRRFDFGQCHNHASRSLAERVSPCVRGGSNSGGGLQSGELTARLIAWQNRQLRQSAEARSKRGVAQGVKEEEEEEEFPRGKNPGRLTEAVLSLGGVGTLDSAKRTALSATRGSDAPSTTHPAVATPDQQQQQQRFPESGEFPQSQQRRTQRTTTRCAPGSAASQVARYKRPETTATPGAKVNKEDVMEPELKEKDERKSSTPSPELPAHCGKPYNEDGSSEEDGGPSGCSRTHRLSSLYHGTWPVERGLWNSQQTGLGNQQSTSTTVHNDIASVMSFSSSVSMGVGCPGGAQEMQGQRRLGAKVDVVYSLLGMLGGAEGREDMSATLLSMSNSTDSCLAMRQSGCLPLLVQLIHAPGQDPETRDRASQAIHNIVHSRGEERAGRREARVLRLLEQLRDYCQSLRTTLAARQPLDDFDRHPGPTIAALMKLSFDEAHRHAMCQLGGLHAVAELIEMDHAAHGSECDDQNCVTLRRYAVSDVDRSHKFTDHQQEQTSLTFPQYDSLGLLSGFDEHSSLASNSSLRLESFTGNEFLESPAESMSVNNLQPVCTSNMQNQESTLSDQHLSHAESYSVMHNTFVNDVTPNGLTIDDEPKIANDSRLKEYSAISAAGISESDEIGESLNLGIGSILEDREEDTEVNEVDNGSDHLFADVTSEAEAARHKTPFRRNSLQKSPQPVSNLTRYQTSSALDQVDITGPVSLITETQNFRHSTHDATGGPASLTMETLNFRHPAHDANDTFMGDTENPTREISRIPSLVTELPRCSSAGLEDISNVLEQDAGSNKLDICRNTTKPAFTLPALENEELDLTVENVNDKQESILDVAAKFFVEKIAENVSETTCRPAPSTSGNRVSPEPTTTLQEENVVENQSEDQHVENASTDIPHLIPKNILSENENTTSNIFFDYRVGSENSTNGEGVEEKNSMKLTEYSPGISPSKIEDDIENMNNSEEDNLSDEVTSPTIDPLFSAVERAACNKGDRSKNREETEEEYRRQRDPDAMIASLDRLTATLVQQTEAMRERDSSAMKQSVVSDTWNEDSPNDVSFPSISVSAPLIASFKSDNQEDQTIPNPEYSDELIGTQEVMTDSRIIEQEANKLAAAVNARVAEFDLDAVSMTSMDLDAIKPPSTMGSLVSLTTSLIGPIDTTEHSIVRERCHSASLPPLQLKSQISIDCRNGRKKSLPAGVMAKRALSQYQNHTGSLENLLSETGTTSMSHLENVKPPSMMDELLDAMDMENSMLSVASITSEVADTKDQDSHSLTSSDPIFDLLKPVANILSMTCMRYAESMQVSGNNSLSECLENINPPSLFNEVSEMDESTMEPTSETFCSDTLCIDNELQTEEVCRDREISIDRIEECDNDTDDAATSIPSEYCVSSSAESTPKKWHNKSNLTPKQKRQLAKERYKTYTIAAEMVKKEEEERRKNDHEESKIGKYARGKCSPFSKLTPKQRRQEDRARFQTQVLNNPFPELVAYNATECQTPLADNPESPETEEASSAVKSCIPTLRKLSGGKTIKQKRAENKDRYRTRTLDDEEAQEASKDVDAVISGTHFGDSDASLETMLLITPGEMKTKLEDFVGQGSSSGKPIGEDVLTVSKAQNLTLDDFESEYDSRVRVADGLHKRFGKSQLSEPTAVLSFTSRFNEQKQLSPSKDSLQDLASPAEPESQGNSDSNNESDEESNSANNQSQIPKRPRIVKPGTISRDASVDSNATDKSESESPKTIRGRRKALYFKPTTRKSTPTTSPSKIHNGAVSGIPIGRSNTSPLVRGTRATTLRQTHNPSFPTKHQQKSVANSKIISPSACAVEKRIQGSALTANKTSIPQRGTVFNYSKSTKRHTTPLGSSSASYAFKDDRKEPAIKPLERQGTFTKEEPEVENAPTVLPPCSPNRSKIAKPIKTSPSKIQTPNKSKPITKILQTQQSKFTKANNLDKDQARNSSPTVTYQKRSLIGSPIKNSPSNQSLQSNESARTTKKTNCLGQRSNSNSSIVSNSSTGIQGRRTSKEATSKIASLWKRVEESKTKQRFEKNDTRHWITPANDTIESGNPVVTTKPPTFRLIRSSTFEGVPKDISRNGSPGRPKSNVAKQPAKVTDTQGLSPKYRNSCDLTGMSIAEAHCKIPVKYPELSAGTRNTIQIDDSTVILRKPQTTQPSVDPVEVDPTKRVSRLGSFIRVEPPETEGGNTQMQTYVNSVRTPASAIVPPFNYNPKQSNPVKANISEIDGKLVVTECQMEITTSSMRVTTV
ncbi:uncharacterized protein [Neodiprion pinetum]|uniref:uncharacterized protein isoform X7 n=1 Tax=Neodiprion pinetum TaxID=441929 RepID=UPI001EDD1DFB|nr:uncharacterized protein LOC124214084 isoform X8 [Neodiprion pinetum]